MTREPNRSSGQVLFLRTFLFSYKGSGCFEPYDRGWVLE